MRVSTVVSLVGGALLAMVFCPTVWAGQPAASAPPAQANLWQYVHPDTRFLAGVDWQRARSSATGRMIAKQLAGKGQQFTSSGPAMAIFEHFDRLLISTTGREVSTPGQQPPMVAAVEGRVDRASMKKLMPVGTAVERFKGVDLFVPPKGQDTDMLLALVSDRVALIGDRDSITRILETPTGTRDAALLDRAMQLSVQCEMWMVSAVPPGQAAGNSLPAMKQLDDIESLDLGVSLAKGLGLRANLFTKTEDSAKGLAALAQLVTSMAAQSPQQSPELAAIMKNLDVKTEGKAVRIAMDVSLAQLEKGMVSVKSATQVAGKKSLESFLGMDPPSQSAAVMLPKPVVAAKPLPPQKHTIRISGMEDGPKEIVYEK
ncbi:MAG TPA: hypothetical protein VGK29_01475 [Paludibaculum sp.]|jgi:hypothetical protein